MKRKSARPFTVEIKHTRTSRTSTPTASARTRAGERLWGDLDLKAKDARQEARPVRPTQGERPADEAPARRILPNLMPTFAAPDEPDTRIEPAEPRSPRVRRPRVKDAATKPVASKARASVSVPITNTSLAAMSVIKSVPASEAVCLPSVNRQSRSPRRIGSDSDRLRLGERWKRRLPRVLR